MNNPYEQAEPQDTQTDGHGASPLPLGRPKRMRKQTSFYEPEVRGIVFEDDNDWDYETAGCYDTDGGDDIADSDDAAFIVDDIGSRNKDADYELDDSECICEK